MEISLLMRRWAEPLPIYGSGNCWAEDMGALLSGCAVADDDREAIRTMRARMRVIGERRDPDGQWALTLYDHPDTEDARRLCVRRRPLDFFVHGAAMVVRLPRDEFVVLRPCPTDEPGAALWSQLEAFRTPRPPPSPPPPIGWYLSPGPVVHRGAYGLVHRIALGGEDLALKRVPYHPKEFPRARAADEVALAMQMAPLFEAKGLPPWFNPLRGFDLGETELRYTAPYLPDGTLDAWLDDFVSAPAPAWDRLHGVLMQLVLIAALAQRHAELKHNDLKPANVCLVRAPPRRFTHVFAMGVEAHFDHARVPFLKVIDLGGFANARDLIRGTRIRGGEWAGQAYASRSHDLRMVAAFVAQRLLAGPLDRAPETTLSLLEHMLSGFGGARPVGACPRAWFRDALAPHLERAIAAKTLWFTVLPDVWTPKDLLAHAAFAPFRGPPADPTYATTARYVETPRAPWCGRALRDALPSGHVEDEIEPLVDL